MDTQQRIEQWEKMTQEAPDGMSWFSLGNAYRDADRTEDAIQAFRKAIEHDASMSRAYQLLGQALIQTEQLDEAQTVLTRGYVKAAEQGDVMPQKAMGALLQEKLGMPLPRVEQTEAPAAPVSGDQVLDRRTGQVGERMPDPPMRGPLGQFIYDNYSMETWREWIATGTKVINELRLDFSNAQHQELYEQHMKEWLGISDEEIAEYDKQNNEG